MPKTPPTIIRPLAVLLAMMTAAAAESVKDAVARLVKAHEATVRNQAYVIDQVWTLNEDMAASSGEIFTGNKSVGRWTAVFVRENGQWKMKQITERAPLPVTWFASKRGRHRTAPE